MERAGPPAHPPERSGAPLEARQDAQLCYLLSRGMPDTEGDAGSGGRRPGLSLCLGVPSKAGHRRGWGVERRWSCCLDPFTVSTRK